MKAFLISAPIPAEIRGSSVRGGRWCLSERAEGLDVAVVIPELQVHQEEKKKNQEKNGILQKSPLAFAGAAHPHCNTSTPKHACVFCPCCPLVL